MKNLHKSLVIAALLGAAQCVQAQEASRSGYFMDGYSFRHELNPAFANDHNYISIPALGSVNASLNGNVGVNTFLYKLPSGQLTTFMSPDVKASKFLGKLKSVNHID